MSYSLLESLPTEITVLIAEQLSRDDLWNFAKTSKEYYGMFKHLLFKETKLGLTEPDGDEDIYTLYTRVMVDSAMIVGSGFGDVIREIDIGLHGNVAEGEEAELCKELRWAISQMPNLSEAHIRNGFDDKSPLYRAVLETMAKYCRRIQSLAIDLAWSDLEFGDFRRLDEDLPRLSSLKSLSLYLDASGSKHSCFDVSNFALEPILQSFLANGLQNLTVDITSSETPELFEATRWEDVFITRCRLKSLCLVINAPFTDGVVDFIPQDLKAICKNCPDLEYLEVEFIQCQDRTSEDLVYSITDSLSLLKKCETVILGFNIYADLYPDEQFDGSAEMDIRGEGVLHVADQAFEARRDHMIDIAVNMKSLKSLTWKHHIGLTLLRQINNEFYMTVKRGRRGNISRLLFSHQCEQVWLDHEDPAVDDTDGRYIPRSQLVVRNLPSHEFNR